MKPSTELPTTGHRLLRGTRPGLRRTFDEVPDASGATSVAGGRVHGLAEAIMHVNADLDLHATLEALVTSAMALTDAKYGGLGVWGPDGCFDEVIPDGAGTARPAGVSRRLTGRGRIDRLRHEELSRHSQSTGLPSREPATTTFLGVQIRVRNEVFGALYLTQKRGGGDFTKVDEVNIRTFIAAASTAVDHARMHEKARVRLAWNQISSEIRTELMAGPGTLCAFAMIARGLVGLTDADMVLVARPLVVDQPPDAVSELVIAAAEGDSSVASLLGRVISIGQVARGHTYADLRPLRRSRLDLCAVVGQAGVDGPAMIVPLATDQTFCGLLVVSRLAGRSSYTQETLALASDFADQIAQGISMAAAVDRGRELEVLADRERIARVLHDHVIQRIFAAGMNVQGTLQRAQSPVIRRRLTETTNDLQDIIQEVRTTIFDLQPDSRGSTRLRQRVHEVIDQQTRDFAGRTFVRMSGPMSVVTPRLAEHAVAVVREGVTNAVHYAEAETITVSISVDDDLVIEIVDDGIGMDGDVTPSGLTNLRGRAHELGGDLALTANATGSGVALKWWAPFDQ
ncbi:GAF domain-containing protein [Williamsia limnetica]|uniref:GAF domain-containing protein n=1 Tax=Williamsia limnetica TaxID=882452 RepID=A0A318RLF2_WILLI|nr:GAF domain-containing sensor histidine kinase [Williamsia limnetica]PYE17859.1 GAF domain-containing protein [Williamsia limnetica]